MWKHSLRCAGGGCLAVVVASGRCEKDVAVVVALWWSLRCGGRCVAGVVASKTLCQRKAIKIHVIKGIDPNRWSYFEAIGIVKDFKYDADFKLWWKGSKQRLMNNIRLLSDDMEALYLANYAEETKEEIDMYVEHVRSEALEVHFLTSGEVGEVAEQERDGGDEQQDVEVGEEDCDDGQERDSYYGGDEEEKDEMGEEGQDCDIGDEQQDVELGEEEYDDGEEEDKVRNVVEGYVEASDHECLDDSEEDRMANDDDRFGVENARVEQVLKDINPVLERWNTMKKKKKKNHVSKRGNVGEGSFIINEEVDVDDMNEEYNSDELDSNVDSDEDERVKKAKFKKYKQDDMSKNFKFQLGMEFCTLREFKNAVMEHNVLNGKEVKFVKNDLTRARAVCKNKCGFVIMASKVGGKLENPEDYVHPYYKKEAYVTCYEPEIVPINGQQLWSTSDTGALLPPIYKTPPGRPKKLRRRDADEYVSHVKLSKKNVLMKCSSCNEFGLNVRTCKRRKKKNIRGTSSVGGSGSSRATSTTGGSEAQPTPSMSQGRGRTRRVTSQSGRLHPTIQPTTTGSGAGPSSTHQSGRRTSSRLMGSQDLGS
ncbi:hypothetical protein V8G54_009524 [Vigna mungo]|uniref:Transposase MuDR plant domain-containing protein n=1 Tax=Vigna mungo TaxID=3915 RepID=A0AAQ3NWX2_VIGMU